ncbi:MAG: hypothetical protein ACFFER_04785 [Candidatus Thorarchaeota archaeon]
MKKYLMRETVYFNEENHFEVPPRQFRGKMIEVVPHNGKLVVSYGLSSQLYPNDILASRVQMSQIVHGLFGSGFQNYDTELHLIRKKALRLVGFVRSRLPHFNGKPLLKKPYECVLLLVAILRAQLGLKSSLSDGLIAAMSQANMGGFVNTGFAWAWWGFEWLIQHLERMNPLSKKLDYLATDPDGQVRNIRKYLKATIRDIMSDFKDRVLNRYEFTDSYADHFQRDMTMVYNQINKFLLEPSFIEKFDSQLPYLRSAMDSTLNEIQGWPSYSNASNMFQDWLILKENLIGPAKTARDKGFHLGKYEGILEGEGFEIYEGMRKFVSWVVSLLAFLLARLPFEYDPDCKEGHQRFTLSPLPSPDMDIELLVFPERGTLEWTSHSNNEILVHSASVECASLSDDYLLEIVPEHLPKALEPSSLIEGKQPRYAGVILQADNIEAKGQLMLDSKPIRLQVHKLLVKLD